MRGSNRMTLIVLAILGIAGCSDKPTGVEAPRVGVTTTWLQCAVRDIAGEQFEILCLLPPGDCPGHFDVSPGTIRRLSRCPLLFRFDFQRGVDNKLSGMTSRGLRIVEVNGTRGLCVPDSYLEACRRVAEALAKRYPASAERFRSRLLAVEERVSSLAETAKTKVADGGFRGVKVIASGRQEMFCGWLGLDVVAALPRAENTTSSALEKLIALGEASGVRLIVSNLQEGRRAADSVAQRIEASVVVFSNFPSMDSGQQRFDDLLLNNLASLIQGAKP